MSDLLIDGKTAYNAVLDGKRVEWLDPSGNWNTFTAGTAWAPCELMSGKYKFRLIPETVLLNGIEAPKPKKPTACYSSNGSVVIVMDDDDKAIELCRVLREIFK